MSFNILRAIMRRRIARAVVGLLILAGVAFAEYKLTNIARPVDIETVKDLSPASVARGQELIIEEPVVTSEEGLLLSHDGMPNEDVEIRFESARLDDETIGLFESLGLKPPSKPARLDYRSEEPKSPSTVAEPCRTRIELHAASKKMPAELHLYQRDAPGGNNYRHLALTARGADLVSRMATQSPNDSDSGLGCRKLLSVGDWDHSTVADVTAISDQNTLLRLYFRPLKPDQTPWADAEGFVTLDLGVPETLNTKEAQPFRARAVSIRPLGGGDSDSAPLPVLSARSTSDRSTLSISDLKVYSDHFQLSIAGKGWVQINGEAVTVGFFERLKENLLISTILGAIYAALLAWVARFVLKSPSSSPQHAGSQARGRKSQRRRKGSTRKSTHDE